MKGTKHEYRGFEIIGTYYVSSGGYVLGGRHHVEGGVKRNYIIKKDGKPIFKHCIINRLKDAKTEIDEYILRHNIK